MTNEIMEIHLELCKKHIDKMNKTQIENVLVCVERYKSKYYKEHKIAIDEMYYILKRRYLAFMDYYKKEVGGEKPPES